MNETMPSKRSRVRNVRAFGSACITACTLSLLSPGAQAIKIQIDYSFDGGFFSGLNAPRRALMEAAAAEFGSRLNDSLAPIVSSGGNRFDATFTRPDTRENARLNGYSVAADTAVVFVGGSSSLGSLGIGGPGSFSARGTFSFLDGIAQRGQSGVTVGAAATDFAPWGGAVSFDADRNDWYFDDDPSTREPAPGLNDFYSVALHELGHVFGIGTSDAWEALVDFGVFTGEASMRLVGGDVPLSVDLAHWDDSLVSIATDGEAQETLMDPSLLIGTRSLLTQLDLAGLRDIGWQVTVVPLPATGLLLLSALGLLILRRRG